eukprot:CAMPEP_0184699232 /NCGR_PEP_ID=MMETSP0313-20130426/5576_1 /TAXON_ID=2792 /ORGANISM="Porphyridium aerugineum, Strain SAG 1380-2" /LENGTH=240 /DNA_ID=CAMNT_0027158289 /DNA_START=136 /DNA_END=858 /DNA_ORIENTATION=+
MEAFIGSSGASFSGRAVATRNKYACNAFTVANTAARKATGVSTSSAIATEMKVFDWKKRGNAAYAGAAQPGELTLSTLIPAPGSRHRKKRKGRGEGAGQGRSCGFGMRGQKSRSGRPTRPGFEGGQTPLHRRLPKYVGRPTGPGHQHKEYALIKISDLNKCPENMEVCFDTLLAHGFVTRDKRSLRKVVGGEELTVKGLTVKAHAFTSSAVEAIEKAGGKCVLLSPTTGEVIQLEEESQE